MAALPAGWSIAEVSRGHDSVTYELRIETSLAREAGTTWPYGCRWCGASNSRDTVEYCEQLEGVVHVDCHDSRCGFRACAEILCTEDRCDSRDECDGCFEAVCHRHGVSECLC